MIALHLLDYYLTYPNYNSINLSDHPIINLLNSNIVFSNPVENLNSDYLNE